MCVGCKHRLSVLAVSFVGGCIHEAVQFAFISNLDFYEPTVLIWGFVEDFWGIDDFFVDFQNSAANGEVDFGSGFNRFDSADAVASADFVIRIDFEFYVNDIGEGVLRVVGNADDGDAVFNLDPFVGLQILSSCGYFIVSPLINVCF